MLLYLPIYDAYIQRGKSSALPALLQHFDGMEHGFKGMPIEKYAETLWQKGYGFDYISDKQLLGVTTVGGKLQTGGNTYRTILVPDARIMPLATFQQLLKLAQNGATIVFVGAFPDDVNGLNRLAARRGVFKQAIADLKFTETVDVQRAVVGKAGELATDGRAKNNRPGALLVGKNVDQLLVEAGVPRETLVDQGLQFIRRQRAGGLCYFIVNKGEKALDVWVPLQTADQSVALFNPMTETTGMAATRTAANGTTEVYLQLLPGESAILQTTKTSVGGPAYAYRKPAGTPQPIIGTWTINFVTGGPELPKSVQTTELGSWTKLDGDAVKKFSGTAAYTITFPAPAGTGTDWLLDLGQVAESAQVTLNGKAMGTLIGPVYQVLIPRQAMTATNTLTVTVSNGMANRIANMDRNRVPWKKFYNINMSARLKEDRDANGLFTAERWLPRDAGLLGPVTLTPVEPGVPTVK